MDPLDADECANLIALIVAEGVESEDAQHDCLAGLSTTCSAAPRRPTGHCHQQHVGADYVLFLSLSYQRRNGSIVLSSFEEDFRQQQR